MLANTGSIPSTEATLVLFDTGPSTAGGEGEREAKKLSSSSAFWNVIGMGGIDGGGDDSLLPGSSSDVGAPP